jgi:hypothetical protein
MIRIDEIYNNTFWPWLDQKRPGTRLFVCEPFGRSDPDSVINYGRDDVAEVNYTFFFDQEPIDLARHFETFQQVKSFNIDLATDSFDLGTLVTSEKNSDAVDHVCEHYGWKSAYYFFHGWASLDWYRGYNHSFLITPPAKRRIIKTFIMPNRIIAGQRQHRLIMLYHIFRTGLQDNHISCPAVCPAENIAITAAVKELIPVYPDIEKIFIKESFPREFAGETGAPMHSCWLSLFEESAESLLYLVTETVATGRRLHLTEKTFKPICLQMPFIIVSTQGALKYLRSYGFRTFGHVWDESYDDEADDHARYEKIAQVLTQLDGLSAPEKQKLYQATHEVVQHNYDHFYRGGFEQQLWSELQAMLDDL